MTLGPNQKKVKERVREYYFNVFKIDDIDIVGIPSEEVCAENWEEGFAVAHEATDNTYWDGVRAFYDWCDKLVQESKNGT